MFAGDSHTRNAIAPRALGQVANVAVAGEHYLKTAARLPWLLDTTGVKVDAVVLPLEATSFTSWKSDHFQPEAVWGRYVDLVAIGAERGDRVGYAGRALKARMAPYVGELDTVISYVAGEAAFRGVVGRAGVFAAGSEAARRGAGVASAVKHFEGQRMDDPAQVAAFRGLVADLRGRGIRVVLMSYPVSDDYFAGSLAYRGRTFAREAILAPMLEAGEVEFLDYEDALFGRDGAFMDADHLNVAGAIQFSKAIRPRLVAMGLLAGDE